MTSSFHIPEPQNYYIYFLPLLNTPTSPSTLPIANLPIPPSASTSPNLTRTCFRYHDRSAASIYVPVAGSAAYGLSLTAKLETFMSTPGPYKSQVLI
ncbi:hypothetical protein AA0113_g10530 [Alternaria arborescens]|uniref:Uncharacterized protein n=1 Tax=Alternaria arborescens TaxID=156630 RepID=A0A4Q4QP41_9PLEO|nr:hypothetical protein AA0111_g12137 [Alternaria arborescens]RYO14004.1 hypothetical protein AA0111_g12137 [Alternaria arborescens]RYO45221.1 hypothetical protein AA0113_g10530 [Alternaria arborescens]